MEEPIVPENPSVASIPAPAGQQPLSGESLEILQEKEKEEEVPLEKNNTKLFIAGSIFMGIVVGLTVALIVVRGKNFVSPPQEISLVTASPSPVASVSAFVRSEVLLEVYNGSGVSGAAGKAAGILEELGYKIAGLGNSEVQTGNSLLLSKAGVGFKSKILEDLKGANYVASYSGELVGSTASARLILGK